MSDAAHNLARLPQVDALLQRQDARQAIAEHGRGAFADAVRATLDAARTRIRAGGPVPRPDEIVADATARLHAQRSQHLRRVINATGVVLHTNLGRAPLSGTARAAVQEAAGYTTLEYDLAGGGRGSRTAHVGALAAELCGAEAATAVNNGAAALVLVLAALATGREVVVSRGELIEIGGSYRLPDVMAVSGARLREVGTTNRTRPDDYDAAITEDTGLLLKVHQSNYAMVGFAAQADAASLADLAQRKSLPFVYDVGSGLIHDEAGPLRDEPSVRRVLRDGADLVIFSGDKLLGGPQAGIIAGRADLVLRCTRHPLARAFRIDKLQRAALEATLEAHLRAPVPMDVPTVAMLHTPAEALAERATWMAEQLGAPAVAERCTGLVGGGALPGVDLPSWAVSVPVPDPELLARHLREGDPPVIGRVEGGRCLLDLRTVPPSQDAELVDLVLAALG